jgi:deoxyadenosine/deoxycytidine kinase
MDPLVYSIEGNIGTGKSTFLEKLKEHYKGDDSVCFLPEPTQIWDTIKDKNGVTILEKYYENQERYAFSFQMMAFISRLTGLKSVLKNNKYSIIIMERSLFTDCNVFAKMLYDDKKIEDIEYTIYQKWYNDFIKELPPISFIYLRTEPIISLTRVKERNREGETIPLEYLENCHKYHDNWLLGHNAAPLLKIDANVDMHNNPEIILDWVKATDRFINHKKKVVGWPGIMDVAYYIQERLF